jgi:glycosyltransferase involved in cell wall biosynthesis
VPAADRTWIVIAAYNEGRAIGAVASELVAAGWPVVVVDDGSADDTATVARAHGGIVLRHVINRGQGAALQTGIDYAIGRGAEAIVTFDADGQHTAGDVPALFAALDNADVALGTRFAGAGGNTLGATRRRRAMLRIATAVSNRISGMRLTDAHCGLRAFRATAAPALRITQDRMAHASELLARLRVSGLRWVEVPVTVRYTAYSVAKGQTAMHGLRILFDYLFRPARAAPPERSSTP